MLQSLRRYIGTKYGILTIQSTKDTQQDLTSFYSTSKNVFVIMPEDVHLSELALTVVKFLEKKFQGYNCVVIASAQVANLVSQYTKTQVVRFKESDINYFFLPKQTFINRFKKRQYDVVIDLNFEFVIFAAYLSNKIPSQYRVSFSKEYGDYFYNIQYRYITSQSKQLAYNSLCEFLEQF